MSLNHAEELSYRDAYAFGAQSSPEIVDADALRCFSELVADLDGDPDELLRQAGIDSEVLATPGSAIEYRALLQALRYASEELSCPDFGLRLAAKQGGNRSIGPIGVVMKNSKTLGQAIGYCAKHIHAYSAATKVRFEPNRARHLLLVKLEILLDERWDKRQAVEHALMLASLNILELAGPAARVKKILLRHSPLSPLMTYRSYFGCEVLFGQKSDGLVLTEQDLLRPVVDPDQRIFEMATAFIDSRYPLAEPPIQARVRRLILQNLGSSDCTSERIAAGLRMHPRTLQRRLRAERTSFEDIKDNVRREVALRYIHKSDIPLKRVAQKLGYAQTSVLSRSCYRWFSATPKQLRLQYQSQLPPVTDLSAIGRT